MSSPPYFVYCLYVLQLFLLSVEACNRRPQGANGDRSPVDENFQILIEGNPQTYIPGQRYNVSLACDEALKFISYTLVVESESASPLDLDMVGHLEIIDPAETKFSLLCGNMIESANTNPKTRVTVAWIAPTNPESGCVLIKSAVLQHRNVWFIDDGLLTKRLCPEEIDEINSQTPPVKQCCACDEAKYELIIERKWNRNTHAKDFPVEAWRTRFSEIIGASHTQAYRFWEYGTAASEGLKLLAEHGSTQQLEVEIKAGEIRTIIKAPGVPYRGSNTLSSSLANVRVDADHHLISLVTKIEPSPDWILGVAGLELCLANCTWIAEKVLNLYPWDIGTDAGPSYMSPDQPQVPPDVVRRITSTFPSDPRFPFYDESGAPMKPLATLHIKRKKLYERVCDSAETSPLECATHPWNSWSECSTRCGPGMQYRSRAYKDPALAQSFKCEIILEQSQTCVGDQCGGSESPDIDVDKKDPCLLTPWSAWSECSKRCGSGISRRTRNYVNAYFHEKCQQIGRVPALLEETRECQGTICGGSIPFSGYNNNNDMNQYHENDGNEAPNVALPNYQINQYSKIPKPGHWFDRHGSASYGTSSNNRYVSPGAIDSPVPESEISNADRSGSSPANENNENVYESPNPPNMNEYNWSNGRADTSNVRQFEATTRRQQTSFSNQPNVNYPYRDPIHSVLEEHNNELDTYDIYGTNGPKTVVVQSSDPNNYAVVQEFCFEKPRASRRPCNAPLNQARNLWFYDAEDRECKLYTSDGCDENKNSFRSLETCEGDCLNPHRNYEQQQQLNQWSEQFGQPRSLLKPPPSNRRYRNRLGARNRDTF